MLCHVAKTCRDCKTRYPIFIFFLAQTTVNITQRPGTQAATRASAPRAPHMVYTTTTLPTIPVQTPVRNTVMQNQNLRQMTPQAGGKTIL